MKKLFHILAGLLVFALLPALAIGGNPFVFHSTATGANPVAGQFTQNYVSLWDINMPEKRNALIRKYGDQGLGFMGMVSSFGLVEPIANYQFSHFEKEWIHHTFTNLNAVSNPGAGQPITVTLSPSDVSPQSLYYPRLFYDVIFPNYVTGKIVNIDASTPSAPVLTIQPFNASQNIGAIAAGQALSIYSNGFPTGTAGPRGQITQVSEYTFNTQIIKGAFETDNSALTNQTWIDKDSTGKSINPYVYVEGLMDAEFEYALSLDGAALFNNAMTNTTLTNAGHTAMQGLVPYMFLNANNQSYTPGLVSLPQFDIMTKRLSKQFAPKEHMGLLGEDLYVEMENLLVDFNVQNPMVWTTEGSKDPAKLHIDVKQIKKNGYTFNLTKMDIFSHPQIYNAAGYTTTGLGLFMPSSKKKDAKGDMIPYVGMVYKEFSGYSRKKRVWATGGGNDHAKNSTVDALRFDLLGEWGTRFAAVNQMSIWKNT